MNKEMARDDKFMYAKRERQRMIAEKGKEKSIKEK